MRGFSQWVVSLFASPAGVVVLAALDSTIFFTLPFGIDAAVVLLAAHRGTTAWLVPVLATAGSLAGAAISFWMGAKLGESWLEHRIPPQRLERIRKRVSETGAVPLAVLDLMPPPFPITPFVLAAGALHVDTMLFFATLAAVRLVRFGVEAILAAIYGPRIIAWLQSDVLNGAISIIVIVAVVASAVSMIRIAREARRVSHRPRAAA